MNSSAKAGLITSKPMEITVQSIQSSIYTIRNQQVMLDADLAAIYGYEVRALNQQVKRNISRFPEDFMFQLTKEEVKVVKSQIVISSDTSFFAGQSGGRRKPPYAFTEQGIYMLGTVLRGQVADQQTIYIMRAFREMRHFYANNELMFQRISSIELRQLDFERNTDEKFDIIFDYIHEHEESTQKVFFDGQIFDAFSLIADIISKATQDIILVDGYVDTGTLDLLSKKQSGVHVSIYTTNRGDKLTVSDITTFNTQYPSITKYYTSRFHDRFLILDHSTIYHIGASLKDAGKKSFAISLIEDTSILQNLLNRL